MAELITVEQAKTFLVADLKAALKERGASIVGKKAELFERLCQLLEEEGNEKIAGKVEGRQSPTEQKIQEQPSIIISSSSIKRKSRPAAGGSRL